MKKIFCNLKQILLAVLLFSAACSSKAATVYVSQGGGVFNGGSACNGKTAISIASFNASTPTGGNTYELCGTITSNVAINGSGTVNNLITLLFDTNSSITMPTCNTNCLNLNGNSYILVDGGTPCGWNVATNTSEGACNGVIQDTANGSNLATQNVDIGIYINGSSNVEVRNLGIYNMYVEVGPNFANYPSSDPNCINLYNVTNVSIHDIRCHDASGLIQNLHSASVSNISVFRNDAYNVSAVFNGASFAQPWSNTYFYGNREHDGVNWDAPVNCNKHLNGWYVFGAPSVTMANTYFYNNIFDGNWGTCITSRFFSQTDMTWSGLYIFNNIFAPSNVPPGGDGEIGPAASSGTIFVYNNTFIMGSGAGIACNSIYLTLTPVVKNNIYQCGGGFTSEYSVITNPALDYNVYSTVNGAQWVYANGGGTGTFYSTFAEWKSATGGDVHGVSTSTGLTLDPTTHKPQTGSPAIGTGTNLSSVCSGQPNPGLGALCSDIAGNLRPSSGAWDAGAYQSVGSTSQAPNAPTGLVVSVQ